jgi:hypothetical protein
MTVARLFLNRLRAVKDMCVGCVIKNRAHAPVRRKSRIGKKADNKPLTCVTVRDVIKREHKLVHVRGQKKSQYWREGLLQYDLVYRIVLPNTRLQYTRSRANIRHSVYLHTTCGRMHTIICKYHELEHLREHSLAMAEQREV